MKVTRLQDIAEKLNITKVAVSKALHDHSDISHDLKIRVRSLAISMGYVPNNLAKNLKARKTYTIGVVVPNITNPFFAHIVNGIISFCADNNYSTLVTISNEKVRIFPNPTDGLITIECSYKCDVSLITLDGKTLWTITIIDRKTFELPDAKGIFLLKIQSPEKIIIRKLLIN